MSRTRTDARSQCRFTTQILSRYCVSCHGPDKQEGEVRLGALETIDAVDRQALFRKVQDVIHLAEMPPEEAKQPNDAERKILLQWLNGQLTGKAAKALAEKLLRFEYGNVVDHKDLFSGEYADVLSFIHKWASLKEAHCMGRQGKNHGATEDTEHSHAKPSVSK